MSSLSTSDILEVIEAIQVHEKIWIPGDFKKSGTTYFSTNDLWLFNALSDGRLCNRCFMIGLMGIFWGNELMSMFPFMEIIDEDIIKANIHLNCRCTLRRMHFVW